MSITTLPTPPSRSDPTNFAVRGDEFLGALPTFGDEANALALDVNTKQTTASAAATTSTTQAGIATTKAGEAAASAASALQSENDAYDLVELYLGASATDPTTGRMGAALVAGNWYINSVSGFIRAYNGSSWVNGVSALAGVSSVNGLTGAVVDIATTNTAQNLTNKTLTAATNNIEASSLKSASSTVSVSSATSPTTGQVLTATDANTAVWQTPTSTGTGTGVMTNVTASRAVTTNYTNTGTTTRWVLVSCTVPSGSGQVQLLAYVGGAVVVFSIFASEAVTQLQTSTFPVPPGAIYSVTGGGALQQWFEYQ